MIILIADTHHGDDFERCVCTLSRCLTVHTVVDVDVVCRKTPLPCAVVVRAQALVRSPSEELRREAQEVLIGLADIDDDVADKERDWRRDQGDDVAHADGGESVTVTTLLVSLCDLGMPRLVRGLLVP